MKISKLLLQYTYAYIMENHLLVKTYSYQFFFSLLCALTTDDRIWYRLIYFRLKLNVWLAKYGAWRVNWRNRIEAENSNSLGWHFHLMAEVCFNEWSLSFEFWYIRPKRPLDILDPHLKAVYLFTSKGFLMVLYVWKLSQLCSCMYLRCHFHLC